MLLGRLCWLWLGPGLQANGGLSLWLHGGTYGSALRLGVQLDHVNPRLRTGECRMIESRRKRLRDVSNKIRRVHHRRSRPRGEERMYT